MHEYQTNQSIGPPLRVLVEAAIRAPSADNLQPWQFVVDPATNRIALCINEAQDTMPMDKQNNMSRIALGAALENLMQTAQHNGWRVVSETPPPFAVAMVRLEGITPTATGTIPEVITQRVTNRRRYDGRQLSPEQVRRLRKPGAALHGIDTIWISDRTQIHQLARLVEQADALMFGDPAIWQEFLTRIRFDEPTNDHVSHGLSLASLEMSALNTLALKLAARFPRLILRLGHANRLVGAHARQLVESASGLCLLVAPDDTPETDINIGRTFEHVWLELTKQKFSVQPMTSLSAIYTMLCCGVETLQISLGKKKLEAIMEQLRESIPASVGRRPAELLRFGYSDAPSGHASRLPVTAVLKEASLP